MDIKPTTGMKVNKQHFSDLIQDTCAYPKSVSTITPEKYVHIELGAGNYAVSDKRLLGSRQVCLDERQIHSQECTCKGCFYTNNRERYAVLEATLSDIIENNPNGQIIFYVNDIDLMSCDQAAKHATSYIREKYQNQLERVSIKKLPGDYFNIKFKDLRPRSVHLKNPEFFFTHM